MGKKLSSVRTDFQENSIKGPQLINQDSYLLEIGGLVNQPARLTFTSRF